MAIFFSIYKLLKTKLSFNLKPNEDINSINCFEVFSSHNTRKFNDPKTRKKPSGYRILAPPAGITRHKCLQHSSEFPQAKISSFTTLPRLIFPRQEDKCLCSYLVVYPLDINPC